MTLLSVRNLAVDYATKGGTLHAVSRGTLEVGAGEVVGLVGESGCGKTTLARALTGVVPRNATFKGGEVVFEGKDLLAGPPAAWKDLLWRRISFVPQSSMNALDPVYRVGTQMEEVLRLRGGLGREAARNRTAELFGLVGLDAKRSVEYPHQFSGGMRQRAAIAMALALEPSLVIADEPVTALDVIVQRQVLDTLRDLQSRLGVSVLLVTHDISVVAYVCDRVVVMYAGEVVESGKVGDVLAAPRHPYTMGLTNAFPDLERAGGTLAPIMGAPPDLRSPPTGCRFAERCPFAVARCRSESPPLTVAADGHASACWRSDEAAALAETARDPATWTPTSASAA
ncbi:ABC transporter ATP-binding protein [uncultured Alsobacter sp.]|uniref:ABC transporter ATP-binding protein n=1 Tax=uncultured Alsobacter sp. TaxID=1748258 RepID=UPI0025EC0C13|nr:ABC transporter ATP-binding protein [uncultured Alsobacter sp.]